MTRVTGNILNVFTYNTGDFTLDNVSVGATAVPLNFAFDFNEAGGEAQIVSTDQIINYTGFDPDTQVLYLDPSTPLPVDLEAGEKIEVLPYSSEKRAVIDTNEGFEPFEARVPHNLKLVLEDGIRTKDSGYESVAIELDGNEWVLKEIYGVPAKISVASLPQIPSDLLADGIAPVASPGVTVTPLGVGALQGRWTAALQPDLHDPIIYDVYVSATTPVVADADHFLTSTAGTSQSFARVPVGGVWVPVSTSEPSYMAVWARDADGLAPTLGGEGSGIPLKADIDQMNVAQLNANTIETLALWAANVNADFVFANNRIQIGDATGSHIVIDPSQGLILYGTNGTTPVVTLDMTAAQLSEFTGKINTNQLAVFESVEIHGLFSKIMSAAYMTIASSTISAPSSPPGLTQSTNTMTWPALPAGFAEYGLYWATNKWRRLIYNASTYETRVEHISSVGASVSSVTLASELSDREARGIVDDGTYFYALRRDSAAAGSGNFYLKKYNYNGTVVPNTGGTESLAFASKFGYYAPYTSSDQAIIRVDGSNVVHSLDATQGVIRRFNTSGVFQGWTDSIPTSTLRTFDVDSSGNYYLLFGERVIKIDSSGTILLEFGASGTGNGQFYIPDGIKVKASGEIYVVDSGNHRVQKFNSSGVYQSQFGSVGTGNGQFSYPCDLAFDSSGNIFVTDRGNDRVQKFNSSHTYQSQFGGFGTGSGLLASPAGIVIDSSNNIFIADNQNYQIQKFNSAGVFQVEFGTWDDDDDGPWSIGIDTSNNVYIGDDDDTDDVYKYNSSGVHQLTFSAEGNPGGDEGYSGPPSIAHDSAGNLWLTDPESHRVKKYDSAGVWQADYGSFGTGNGQFNRPAGIAIDGSNNIYISDSGNNRIQKFNSSMTYQTKWGTTGTGDGQFNSPQGLAVDPTNTYLYVADYNNERVQKFTLTGTYTTKWGVYGASNGQFSGCIDVACDSTGAVYVCDMYSARVQKFTSTGTYTTKWGTFGSGNGQFYNPRGIHITATDSIYVVDSGGYRVQKFDSGRNYLSQLGTYGTANGEFYNPTSVSVDAAGALFVADGAIASRVQKFVGAYPALANTVANEISPTVRTYPALGYDGTNLLIGAVDNTAMDIDNISAGCGVTLYNKSDLEFTGTYYKFAGNIVANTSTSYVGLENFDYGGARVLLGSLTTMRAYTFSGTTLTADTSFPSWTYDGSAKAAAWDGTNFYSSADTTVIRRYSTFKLATGSANRKFWASYQWENGSAQGTTPSPKASFDLLDRRWLNITVPSPGAGTGYTRIFTGNGASSPANSAMYGLAGVLAAAGTVQTATVLGSGTNPKTVADLPSGSAGTFEAEDGSFSVNGNSIGRWDEKGATPRFYGERTTDQTAIVTSTETTVLWTENTGLSKDTTADYWSYASGVVTINKTGWWRYDARIRWDSSGTGTGRRMFLFQNSTKIAQHEINLGGTTQMAHNVLSGWWFFTAGDTVTVKGWHDRGSNTLIDADANGACAFMLAYEGPS